MYVFGIIGVNQWLQLFGMLFGGDDVLIGLGEVMDGGSVKVGGGVGNQSGMGYWGILWEFFVFLY